MFRMLFVSLATGPSPIASSRKLFMSDLLIARVTMIDGIIVATNVITR